ncbi:MAG: hypothetical protein K6B15_06385 [Parasporobacterium sp.]|nr:hypothetical protein [Parasporobacterium sp.]
MSLNKGIDIKLNVKAVFIDFSHDYAYEGPCRFGQGDSLKPEFDRMLNDEIYSQYIEKVNTSLPKYVNNMEAVRVKNYTDEWIVSEADMEKLCVKDDTDVYIVSASGRAGRVILEFAKRVNKPIVYYSESFYAMNTDVTALKVRGYEAFALLDWDDLDKILKPLKVRKALFNTRALMINRFTTNYSHVSSQEGPLDLEKFTNKFGLNFHVMDLHEYLDQLTIRPADSNPTLPGRVQQNINEEDMKEIEKITEDLMKGAIECDMKKEDIIPSVKAFYLTRKLLNHCNCNAFTAPCPDMCSTRRLNEEKCTLCLTHSLNEEDGIPSSCETDFSALLCKIIMENLTDKATYMGNSCWLKMKDGKPTAPDFASALDEELKVFEGVDNLFVTLHSVANRNLKGYNTEKEEYSLRSFAFSGWGATMRYDFTKDLNSPVTVIRINPEMTKMLIIRGKIKGQLGYKRQNCSTACVYQVEDAKAAYEKTFGFGSHMVLTYGDYTKELERFCELMGLEAVFA